MGQLNGLDWGVIVLYFGVVFGVAVWAALTNRKQRDNSAGYFLAGRNVGWFVIGASMFASNIGSEHLVGLAGAGASTGVVLGQFEVQASLAILVLGWLFVPFYVKSGVFTMPEFLERRYSPAARWYLAVVSIISYVLTKISVTIYAGGVVFTALMGIEFWTGAIIVVLATGIYTVFGGLRAVLYTDMIQALVLIGGSVAVTVIGLNEAGGWSTLCEDAGPGMMSMWRPFSDPDFPWTAVLLGAPILGLWYWCTDQFIVQRVLSAKNEEEARRGTIFAGFLKQLPLFIFVIPGVIAFVLVQRGSMELSRPDEALPVLIARLLPAGIRGLVVAGLLAALMSSLSSVFNSCSTLITWDVYRKLRPNASEHHLVVVGQVSTVVLVVLGLAWIPFMRFISGELYTYLQSVQSYIAPPITAVFLLGIFWKRVNAHGALAALFTGFVLGMGRLVAELMRHSLTGWLHTFATIHFLHFALFLFLLCCAILVIVSLLTRPAPDSQLAGLTFATTEGVELRKGLWSRTSLALTLILFGIVCAVWYYFSPLNLG
ncbi:MAG TPA: sodium:solute symporter [Candidatus Hydrogenedentes bacterium]|nr:sodium:solute symporter [Candidatus Hydrogenedentota bacterium]HQH69480.1 sodium:solute symporter [Candidatus Hydrogenedentota bacterium]